MIRFAIFDLDGTLIDSRRDLATAANALLEELGHEPLGEEAVGDMVGEGAAVLVQRVLAARGHDPAHPGAVSRFLELYDEHLLDATRPYDGISELLATTAARMPLAVLTNKPQRATDRILAGLGLGGFFRAVIGGDTPFGRKPDPRGLLALNERVSVPVTETLLVGDSPIDVETARRAGSRICVAAYGFGFRPAPLQPGEWIVHTPRDLVHLLGTP